MEFKQPKDKSHFLLPDLGEGIQEAELIKWRVKPGERVEELDIIAEMETDKALVEVPTPWTGVIKELRGAEGDIINVGTILVTYETTDAPVQEDTIGADTAIEPADAGTVVGSVDADLAVPETLTRRREHETAVHAVRSKAMATPAVRRIAREKGVDINRVNGTGRGGRVTASDVEAMTGGAATIATAPHPALAPPAPLTTADGISQRIPFRGVRRKIAEALDRSVKTAVHFTVVDEADVTALDRKREEYAALLGRKLSILPFVMSAVCKALRFHPTMNANVDDAKGEILLLGHVNLGCAVDTDHGLMVPVLRNADTLGLVQLAEGVAGLAAGCRDRTIDRDDLVGGSFTISNVGSYGGMFATPIINYPEVGILAVGRTRETVLTKDGSFYAGLVLPLSMSCDHRVVDGAEGARFLRTVVELLEHPEALVGG